MMGSKTVWLVGVSDCEATSIICVCATKEIAIKEMFKKRDELLIEWSEAKIRDDQRKKEYIEKKAKEGIHFGFSCGENMWETMIKNLSHDDYTHWDNYPQDVPWIQEREVIE